MKKIRIKSPAKINLTLDVLGTEGGYHQLKSLVASVDLYDAITLWKKEGGTGISINIKGIPVSCPITENNAYITAKKYLEEHGLDGVNISIEKNIPVGGGMGGSSADIAGVLRGLNELFEKDYDLYEMASCLGSDSAYMLDGGFAIMEGRGNEVTKLDVPVTLYILLITESKGISSRGAYKKYDELAKTYPECTDKACERLMAGDIDGFCALIKNDLYPSAVATVSEIGDNVIALKDAGAVTALMTGSGSVTYGIFKTAKDRDVAYAKLYPTYGDKLVKAKTLTREEIK